MAQGVGTQQRRKRAARPRWFVFPSPSVSRFPSSPSHAHSVRARSNGPSMYSGEAHCLQPETASKVMALTGYCETRLNEHLHVCNAPVRVPSKISKMNETRHRCFACSHFRQRPIITTACGCFLVMWTSHQECEGMPWECQKQRIPEACRQSETRDAITVPSPNCCACAGCFVQH